MTHAQPASARKPSATVMSSIALAESGESTSPSASTSGWGVGAIGTS